MEKMKRVSKQVGIGLLELMLSLAIIAVMLIMATRYYQSTSQSQKVNQAANDIQAIIAAFENYRAGNPSSTDFTIQDLSPFLPSTWGTVNDTDFASTSNPWGGGYTAADGGTVTQLTVTVGSVPDSACEALSSLMASTAEAGAGCKGQSGTYSGTFGSSAGSSSGPLSG